MLKREADRRGKTAVAASVAPVCRFQGNTQESPILEDVFSTCGRYFLIGKIPLEKLTSLDLQKFYKKLLASGRVGRIESRKQSKAPPAGRSPRTACCTCSTGC